ncbi:MAG: hypothetical protein JRN52_06440 [Nitrososphaerota archaeon]|nr:hypothetical protein [Nitrososphaerota archaeon]
MEPSLLKKMVKQSENVEIEEEVFTKFRLLMDSINQRLNESKVKVRPEIEPFFIQVSGSSN